MIPWRPRLRDIDSAETVARFRAFAWPIGACLPLAGLVALYLEETRHIGGLAMLGVLLGGIVVGVGLGAIVLIGSQLVARGVVHVITAAGNLEPNRSYSYQDALVARGQHAEAAEAYRAHLAEHPEDHDARIALAELTRQCTSSYCKHPVAHMSPLAPAGSREAVKQFEELSRFPVSGQHGG